MGGFNLYLFEFLEMFITYRLPDILFIELGLLFSNQNTAFNRPNRNISLCISRRTSVGLQRDTNAVQKYRPKPSGVSREGVTPIDIM